MTLRSVSSEFGKNFQGIDFAAGTSPLRAARTSARTLLII